MHATGAAASVPASLLVISELVTNAIAHGGGPIQVLLDHRDDVVRVEVSDSGDGGPRLAPLEPESSGGRGLHIVGEFARTWGVRRGSQGKTVWADVPL